MILVRTITLAGFLGDTWAVPGDQSGPPGGVPLAVAVPSHNQPSPITAIRWRIIPYDVAGLPTTDTTTLVDARIAFLANDLAGNQTVALGPSIVDCRGSVQGLGLTLLDSAALGDLIVFTVPSLGPVGGAVTLRIFADYGAVLR